MAWVGEVKLARQEKVIILGSQGLDSSTRFYFIPESQNGLGVPVVLLPHDFGENGKPARGTLDAHDCTVDRAVSFTSRPVFEDRSLSVLQIVAKSTWNRLYWIGVGKEHPSPDFDLIELAGGSQYANCGDYDVPPSVVDVKNIDHPFRAALQLQPPTVVSDADARPIAWSNGPYGEPPNDCQRTGELRWVGGRFQDAMQEALCKQPEKPGYVQVDDTGKVRLSYQIKP